MRATTITQKASGVKGEWHGKLAAAWGLSGEMNEEHFARLADGQHPLTGEQLVQHRATMEYVNERGEKIKTMEHRAGWDATFSAPKSVSLTALVGGDEQVRAAHRESVNIALNEIENYVQARIGGNHPPETTSKWVAAKFEHDSSRPVDGYAAPQLHTHVVFFNMTERENGETRALQPQELYRSQQYATAVYRSELALRLKALGYEVEQGASGQPEIKGYSREYMEASSPRSQQIKEHLEEQGVSGAGAAQIAAHQTRGAKLDISHEEMQQRHQQMARQFGDQPQRVIEEARQHRHQIEPLTEEQKQRSIAQALTYAREKNLEREAVADERELMRDALKRSMGDASFAEVRAEFQNRIEQGELIETARAEHEPGRAFTTEEMIHFERDNIRLMRAGQNQYETLADEATRRAIAEQHAHLSNSQRAVVEEILTNRDQVMALEGAAGTGKTTSLAAIREAAERDDYKVKGFAPTSRAAHKLAEAGIESSTLQKHLARGEQVQSGEKHLYVLDESSLASTKQMNEFLHRLSADDRVLLVGDVRQHEAVEAGRPYQQLQEAGMHTARLDEIVRQKDPALKEAVEQLARGEVREAIENLDQQGRVHQIEDRDTRLTAIAEEYARQPEGTLVISPDNESRRALNELIHVEMQERGAVSQDEHKVRVLDARQEMTGADRAWATQYEAGDVVRYSKGSKTLGIDAGEYARVTDVDRKTNQITVERENGEDISYDPRRLQGVTLYRETERSFAESDRVQFTAPSKELHVANRQLGTIEKIDDAGDVEIRTDSGRAVSFNISEHPHLDYGYAVTSHSSQGQTADRALIHVDTEKGEQLVNARMAYVSVSRARYDAEIYTNNKTDLAHHLSRDVSQRTATEEHEPAIAQKIGPQSVAHDHTQEHAAAAAAQGQSHGQGQGIGRVTQPKVTSLIFSAGSVRSAGDKSRLSASLR
ncbi:MAG TPA: MobF family relaxase [Candidatus Angelobacter sp.]|nr:MobF family relaxase [Candidatus Angelobacter sp.]